jgi:hypothetical protein
MNHCRAEPNRDRFWSLLLVLARPNVWALTRTEQR